MSPNAAYLVASSSKGLVQLWDQIAVICKKTESLTDEIFAVLTGLGFSNTEARYYQKASDAGQTLVVVEAENRYRAAQLILERNGSQHGTTEDEGPRPSLVLADDKFYATDQEGDTYIFAAKPDFEQLSRNRLNESTNASLAISEGDIFIRTNEHLWCIGSGRK